MFLKRLWGIRIRLIGILLMAFVYSHEIRAWQFFSPFLGYEKDNPVPGKEIEFRAFGPIIEYSSSPDHSSYLTAFRPLWSSQYQKEYYAADVVWPLFVYRDTSYEWYWRFLLFYHGGRKDVGEAKRKHFGFLPLWFWGYDRKDEFYWAFFPLYGTVHDFLSYDDINFIVFPIYLSTKKSQGHGTAWLWPIVNWDESPRYDRFRVFPFYAYHIRYKEFSKVTYMWPFYHEIKYLHPKLKGGGWFFLPFVGHRTVNEMSSWTFLWPFFSTFKNGEDGFGLFCPWPFFQYKNNIPLDSALFYAQTQNWMLYIWPFWGRNIKANSEYNFYLWPFGSTRSVNNSDGRIRWIWALPLFWSKDAWDLKKEKKEIYRRFWPLASYFETKKSCEFRIIDIWPERNMPVIERNWNPLWFVYRYLEHKDKGFRHDFLWGLFSYSENVELGNRFTISPFYSSRYNLARTRKKQESPEDIDTVRDFLMGVVRMNSHLNGEKSWRILWLIDF